MRRYAAKVDASQKDIIVALRKAGAFVWILGQPVDLLVFYRKWHLLECKSDKAISHHTKARKVQEEQTVFCQTFGVPVVRNATEALVAVGVMQS
jgi:hypothetical protein